MINENAFRLKKNGQLTSRCFCRHPEKIENYESAIADTTQIWECHHRREELYPRKELIERGEYYDVPPEDLIFLTPTEHIRLHKKDKKLSKEHKRKIGKALSKKVLCVETGKIFDSAYDAQRKTGIFQSNISSVCNGKLKTTGGYHWMYV